MKTNPKKLALNQQTLRTLTAGSTHKATHHTCVVSNCPFPCTPVAGAN